MKSAPAIALGFLMLLAGSYIDNVRGPLIPILANTFQISYGTTTWFLVLGNIGAVISTFALLLLLQRFSIEGVAKGSCLLFLCLCGPLVLIKTLNNLLLFALVIGAMIPIFGGLANLFVVLGTTEKDRSKWMCALHMIYGSASLLAPLIVSYLIERQLSWYSPYLVYLPVILFTYLLLKKQQRAREQKIPIEKQSLKLAREQWMPIVVLCAYVAAEVMISIWMVSYLKEVRQLSLQKSALCLSGFFVVMTLTRGVCFFSINGETERIILYACLFLSALGFALGHLGYLGGFILAGSLGPFFPVFLSQCSKRFPRHFRSFTLWLLASNQVAMGILNLILGKVSDRLGMSVAYQIPLVLLGLSLVLLILSDWKEKNASAV